MPKLNKVRAIALNQRGAIHFVILFLLLAGIIGGVFLVTRGEPLKLLPKAAPTLPLAPEASFELELEKSGESPFPDEATPTTIPIGSKFRVDVYARSDVEAANLFKANIHFTQDTDRISFIEPLEINRREGQSFVKNWVETASSGITFITLTGGVPSPGIQTDAKSGALLMGSIVFEAKRAGKVKIELADDSAIYSNANNINILTAKKGTIEIEITDTQPSPIPTPTPLAFSCTSVTVEGAIQSKFPTGDVYYLVESEAQVKLTANGITPSDAKLEWKEVSRSVNLTAGKIDYPDVNNSRIVNYTVPKNATSGEKEGVYVRADAVNITPTKSCPTIHFVVNPAPQPSPSPSPTSGTRVFVTSNSFSGDLKSAGSKYGLGTATDGLDGADKICQGSASIAKLGGTWKAWLSDSTTSAASRLNHNSGSYKLLTGFTIANSWADLVDGSVLNHEINGTEFGTALGNSIKVWTNTNGNGEIYSNDATMTSCNDWTSSSSNSLIRGRAGDGAILTRGWTDNTSEDCNVQASLYCFEQTSVAPSPSPIACKVSLKSIGVFQTSECTNISPGWGKRAEFTCSDEFSGEVTSPICTTPGDLRERAESICRNRVCPSPSPQKGSGDGNSDGKVDLADLSILLTDFNKSEGTRTGVDLNGDRAINTFDFSLMKDLLIQKGVIKG